MAGGLKGLEGQQGGQDAFGFDPRLIVIESGFNPRSREELAKNVALLKPQIVAAGGVIQPVLVRVDGERVVLVAGETRVTAMLELIAEGVFSDETLPTGKVKKVTVPTLYRRAAADEKQRIVDALMENTGKPLKEWEVGGAYARLLDLGWSVDDVAAKMGQTVQYVNDCVALAGAGSDVKALLSGGKVSKGAAKAAVKKHGSGAGEVLAAKVADSPNGKVARDRVVKFDVKALKMACATVLEEADLDDPDAALKTVSREAIVALRAALKGGE